MPTTPAQSGILMLMKIANTTAVLTAVAGLRAKSLTFNSQAVDVTNSDSSGEWREILDGHGIKSMSFSGSGIFNNKTSFEVVRDAAMNSAIRAFEVTVPGFGVFAGSIKVTSFELSGAHEGSIEFSGSFESSGAITFTAAA